MSRYKIIWILTTGGHGLVSGVHYIIIGQAEIAPQWQMLPKFYSGLFQSNFWITFIQFSLLSSPVTTIFYSSQNAQTFYQYSGFTIGLLWFSGHIDWDTTNGEDPDDIVPIQHGSQLQGGHRSVGF